MGAFPEPAHRADDACRRVPDETVSRRTRLRARVALALIAATLAAGIPNRSVAHERIAQRSPSSLDTALQGAASPLARATAEGRADGAALAEGLAALVTGRDGMLLRFGETTVPREVVEPILRAASETGADPTYLMALAHTESRFATAARSATSSAEGLFQFLAPTWLDLVRSHGPRFGLSREAAAVTGRGGGVTIKDQGMRAHVLGLRRDPYLAAAMAGAMMARDRVRIERKVGRTLKTSELYVAHLFGLSRAGRFLTLSAEDPDRAAAPAFAPAAKANRDLFTNVTPNGRRSLTVAELRERLDGIIDRRLTLYGDVATVADRAAPRESRIAPAEVAAILQMTSRP